MVRLGFTGTKRGLTVVQRNVLRSELNQLQPKVLIHGACVGADDEADQLAVELGIERQVFPAPVGKHRVPDYQLIWREFNGKGTTISIRNCTPPLVRNRMIVAECDQLIACPAQDAEVLRSGTWATIRAARKAGKKVTIIGPGGIK